MNYELLSTHAQALPSQMSAEDAAAALNAVTITTSETVPIPRRTLKSWLIEIDKLTLILAGQDELSSKLRFVLTDQDYSEIDISADLANALFSAAVATGLFTQAERDQLEAKATITTETPLPRLLGRAVDFADILRVRGEN